MNKTIVIALLGLTLSAAACTTEDPTPPGELVDAGASTDRVGYDPEADTEGGESAPEDTAEDSAPADDAQESAPPDDAQESAPGDQAEESAPVEAGANAVCTGLFEGAAPLADRAEAGRSLISAGGVLDTAQYDEIAALQVLLGGLATEGSSEQARAMEQLNEPFLQVTDSVTSGGAQDPATGEVTLEQIDVSGSAAAQDQLDASCQG